jgi:hypothetical protein
VLNIGKNINNLNKINYQKYYNDNVNREEKCFILHNKDNRYNSNIYPLYKNCTLGNYTYTFNITNSTICIPECYLNCDLHFIPPMEKEYCFVNMCGCEIVSKYDESKNKLLSLLGIYLFNLIYL